MSKLGGQPENEEAAKAVKKALLIMVKLCDIYALQQKALKLNQSLEDGGINAAEYIGTAINEQNKTVGRLEHVDEVITGLDRKTK